MSFPAPTDPGEGGSVEGAASGYPLAAGAICSYNDATQGGDPQ